MAKKANGSGRRSILQPYRSYRYVDGKDPEIFRLKTVVRDEGVSEAQLHVLSGVSVTTFANWFRGDVRRPTHACLAATYGALGYEFKPVKTITIDYASEVPKAAKWYEAQKAKKE